MKAFDSVADVAPEVLREARNSIGGHDVDEQPCRLILCGKHHGPACVGAMHDPLTATGQL